MKIALPIILVILIAIGAWYLLKSDDEAVNENLNLAPSLEQNINSIEDRTFSTNTNSSTTVAPTMILTISEAGITPNSPTINFGTEVTINNDDVVVHQISSDPHPSHTDLPGFDSLIQPGGSFTFTFDDVGAWGYHDHLDSQNTKYQGTINVQ